MEPFGHASVALTSFADVQEPRDLFVQSDVLGTSDACTSLDCTRKFPKDKGRHAEYISHRVRVSRIEQVLNVSCTSQFGVVSRSGKPARFDSRQVEGILGGD